MYEVETLHWGGEWINTWSEDGKILTFETYAEAQDALDNLLRNMQSHDASDYRIVKLEAL
jgi:Tol biopolymer transport system component